MPSSPVKDVDPLAASGELSERIVQGSIFPIIVCTPDGSIAHWNPAARQLLCGDRDCLVNRTLADVFPVSKRPLLAEQLAGCVRSGEPAELQVRLGGTDPEPIQYAITLTSLRDADGGLEYVIAWFRDISPRARLEHALAKSERLSVLGRLAGAVAHHYNNLLCSVATSLEYAMNMSTMTAMKRALGRTTDSISRAASLTRQLLAFARADHRAEDLSDLTETLLILLDEQETRLQQHQILLDVDIQPLPVTSVLREPLRIVLSNIMDNAIDAMPAGGTLTVRLARRDENSVCLTLGDTGQGISQADMERLFEPFHTTKGELGRGSARNPGLGLAVAHGLAHTMGGSITASNTPGSGARFDIVLPLNAKGGNSGAR